MFIFLLGASTAHRRLSILASEDWMRIICAQTQKRKTLVLIFLTYFCHHQTRLGSILRLAPRVSYVTTIFVSTCTVGFIYKKLMNSALPAHTVGIKMFPLKNLTCLLPE
ncbi:hypothetical protein PU00_12015 [Hafnia alvei]|nr:hypothetical protein PU00_12015 [Hafnia alvei]